MGRTKRPTLSILRTIPVEVKWNNSFSSNFATEKQELHKILSKIDNPVKQNEKESEKAGAEASAFPVWWG
jgi:hypothetical protein